MLQKKIINKGRLKGNQLRKLSSLLDMMYKPSEIAEEVGFTRRQIYRAYVPLGCPYERDETGHIWINGEAFRQWYRKIYKKVKLQNNEAYCVSCKNIIIIQDFEEKQKGRYRYQLLTCPNCGGKISKAIEKENSND